MIFRDSQFTLADIDCKISQGDGINTLSISCENRECVRGFESFEPDVCRVKI